MDHNPESETLPPDAPPRSSSHRRHRHGSHSRQKHILDVVRRTAIAAFILLVILALMYVWMAAVHSPTPGTRLRIADPLVCASNSQSRAAPGFEWAQL
jgi:hypothetical protein